MTSSEVTGRVPDEGEANRSPLFGGDKEGRCQGLGADAVAEYEELGEEERECEENSNVD